MASSIPNKLLSLPEAGPRVKTLIQSGDPFFIGRIGGSDWDLCAYAYGRHLRSGDPSLEALASDSHFLELLKITMRFNGFYDRSSLAVTALRYCAALIRGYHSMDLASVGGARLLSRFGFIPPGDTWFVANVDAELDEIFISAAVPVDLLPFVYFEGLQGGGEMFLASGFDALAGKRVLVCSPFEETIATQFKRRHEIFSHPRFGGIRYPDFELEILKTPITYEGTSETPHSNWLETVAALEAEMSRRRFDIALLGCGSYAMALGRHAKEVLGRGAIYIGGPLQLYFGILGRRYEYLGQFASAAWTRPRERPVEETTLSKGLLEALGAYW